MKTLLKTGAVVAAGASIYIGASELHDALLYSAEEQNPKIEACAAQLGKNALHANKLPSKCSELQSGINEFFDYKKQQTFFYDAENNETTKNNTVISYVLPAAQKFRDQHLITPDEATKREQEGERISRIFGAMGSIALGLYFSLQPLGRRLAQFSLKP